MTTKADLQEQLDELGIEYPSSATKADLLDLLPSEAPAPSSVASPAARPVWEAGESRGQYQSRLRDWKRAREPF